MTNDVLERRYGATRTRRWPVITAASVLGVVALAWVTWVALDQDRPLSYQLSGYDVVSDTQTVLTIELNRDDGHAVECEIYAQADDHSIVGERTVSVPAGESGTVRVDEPIKTERRAVNGVLRTCRLAG
ncbi:DUF4307 domain-containing protein [Solicola gregarius]|uniref:DUF4307 domain-containing protein n=1 Tax=Solicola gregarius TaxID=2908642 RepID=A0AA46TK67_9ACTN|nr:DUF4307 domain-containing protein [Solicola gregarius]UYM06394.1 DUF4307 domain-containing protein [Solicola gregarius]